MATEFIPFTAASQSRKLPSFDAGALQQVIGVIQQPDTTQAILNRDSGIADPQRLVLGEVNRLRGLSAVYHHLFYTIPLDHIQRAGLLPTNYTLNELGTSLGGHLPVIPARLQPWRMRGFDNQRHIVQAAQVTIAAFQRAGLLGIGTYEIEHGDHESELPRAEVAVLSLVSQYESGEKGAVEWLVKHGMYGINGDVNFTRFQIEPSDLDKGVLQVTSRRLASRDTGVMLQLESSPVDTPFGQIYEARLGFAADGLYAGSRKVAHIPLSDDNYQALVTVYKEDGQLFAEPWGHIPTGLATEEDIKHTLAFRRTFQDIYSQIGPATKHKRDWDAMAGLGVPTYAAEQGYYSTIMLTTAKDDPRLSASLPWAILMRHSQEAGLLASQERLRDVGPGKTFETLDDLYQAVGRCLAPDSGYNQRFKYGNPILATTIVTSDEQAFQILKAA